ncbi:hypothetical protein, partial [Providencia sp. CRPN09747]
SSNVPLVFAANLARFFNFRCSCTSMYTALRLEKINQSCLQILRCSCGGCLNPHSIAEALE